MTPTHAAAMLPILWRMAERLRSAGESRRAEIVDRRADDYRKDLLEK